MRMAVTKVLLAAAALNVAFSAPATVQAQEISCAAEGSACLQRLTEAACRNTGATRDACEAWLRRLESHPYSNEADWALARGWVYMYLADFATVSSLPDFGSVSDTEARAYRATAVGIFRDTAARAPDNAEALGSVVAISESSDERIRLLRQIVALDPGAFTSVELLVSELQMREQGPAVYLEAAELLETAYHQIDFVPKRWDLAAKALDFYERSGNSSRRDAFKMRWAGDIHFDTALMEFDSEIPFTEKQELLSTLCDRYVRASFGGELCLALIDSAMSQLSTLDDGADKLMLSEHVVSIMTMVAETAAPQPGRPSLKDVYQNNIESIIAMGGESAAILDNYATFLRPEEQMPVLEKAVELAPENGDVRYRLALLYGNQGRWDEAAEQFRAARDYIADWKRPYLEQQLERAESQLSLQ